jgi:hypothetical protein
MSGESRQHPAALDQSHLDLPGVGQFPSGSSSNTVLHPPETADDPWSQKYVLCFGKCTTEVSFLTTRLII